MNQITYGSQSIITSATSAKSTTYFLKKKKILQQYSSDKKKFFQLSKEYATLSSTNKLLNTDSIQFSTLDNSRLQNRGLKSVSTAKKKIEIDEDNIKGINKTTPISDSLILDSQKTLIRSQSKQSFLPQIINFRSERQIENINKSKKKNLIIHISDPLYRVQDYQSDKKNMLKLKRYKRLWKQSIEKRMGYKDPKSLLQRSQQKAKKIIQAHNKQIQKRRNIITLEQMLRDRVKQRKNLLKGQINTTLLGLEGKGGLTRPLFKQIYLAEETYKAHKG